MYPVVSVGYILARCPVLPDHFSPAPTVAAGILKTACFVYLKKQLAHRICRKVPALLALKQRTCRIIQPDRVAIFAKRPAQALAQAHSACLVVPAVADGRHDVIGRGIGLWAQQVYLMDAKLVLALFFCLHRPL